MAAVSTDAVAAADFAVAPKGVFTLPDAVLTRALSLLPLDEILAARSVCKVWSEVLGDETLWRHICRGILNASHPDPKPLRRDSPRPLRARESPAVEGPAPVVSHAEAALQAALWADAAHGTGGRLVVRDAPQRGGDGAGAGAVAAMLPELEDLRRRVEATQLSAARRLQERAWGGEGEEGDEEETRAAVTLAAHIAYTDACIVRGGAIRAAGGAAPPRLVEGGFPPALPFTAVPSRGVPFRLAWRTLPAVRFDGVYALRQEYIRKGVKDVFHKNDAPDGVLRVVFHRTILLRPDGTLLYALQPGEVGEAVKDFRRILRAPVPASAHPALVGLRTRAEVVPPAAGEGEGKDGLEGPPAATVQTVDPVAAALAVLRWDDTHSPLLPGRTSSSAAASPLQALGQVFSSLLGREGSSSQSSIGVGSWRMEGPSLTLCIRSLGSSPCIASRWACALASSDGPLAHDAFLAHADALVAAGAGGPELDPEEWVWGGHAPRGAPRGPPQVLKGSYLPGLPGRVRASYNDLLLVRTAALFQPSALWAEVPAAHDPTRTGSPAPPPPSWLPGAVVGLPFTMGATLHKGAEGVPVGGLEGAFTFRPTAF